jgi:hypothetical protein
MANKILHPLTPLWMKPLHTPHLLQNMPLNFIIGLLKINFYDHPFSSYEVCG